MTNTGKQYELFVAKLQQALLNAENITTQKNIKVEVNKKIADNCGIERQFDIYWEYELGGLTYKTVIECKDYESKVSVEKIDALIGKIKDIPDLKAVFATKSGYQSGTQTKAEQNRIDLLIVREQNDSDWIDQNGIPFIKEIHINFHLCVPARMHKFEPIIDREWIKMNTDINTSQPIRLSGLNNEIFIDDLDSGERYSLLELGNKLAPIDGKNYGRFEQIKEFKNAFIHYPNVKLRLLAYKLEYSISEPLSQPLVIDFAKELDGVIEYLQKGTRKSIFRNGVIKQTNHDDRHSKNGSANKT
jgi:hypothetical protein